MLNRLPETAEFPPRILIVDDDPDNITLLANVLKGAADIFFCTDSRAALQMARDKRPDVVLLDVEMPCMDGFQVCAALKADAATADCTVIFVTAHTDVEHETRALEAGALDFITKPISPPVVLARVRTHLMLKRQADLLRRLALVDGLTGVANRRSFDEALSSEWRRARRAGTSLAVAMIDVDFFKSYNDLYGHLEGDACLRSVASLLAATVRRQGEVVARYGGEEFAVVLPHSELHEAEAFGRRLCDVVRRLGIPHSGSNVADVLTISVGVAATVPGRAGSAEDLVAAADSALYDAKKGGRDRAAARRLGD